MKPQPVVSREYKAMLRHTLFRGGEKALLKAAGGAWRDFSNRIADVALGTKGELTKIKGPRLITFFDTSKHDLNARHYIFRERRDTETGNREVTLKFRHPDRNVAQDRNMKARVGGERSRTKFEEDIKGPFSSLYSFSTTVAIHEALRLDGTDRRRAPLEAAGEPATPSTTLTHEQAREALEVVAALPPRQRQLVGLHAAGFTYDEIAALTGTSHRAVDRHIRRARAVLRHS